MHMIMVLVIVAATILAAAAHADFVIISAPSAAATPFTSETPPTAVGSSPHRLKIAHGFGNQIPLSFAVRQIVPRAVKVTYGRGADPNAFVDWKGGQSWTLVLADAVRSLGLRLVFTHGAVEIRR
jgi:hypothetical protein